MMETYAVLVCDKLAVAGCSRSEIILNERNYIEDWNKNFIKSVETIIGMKGAAFTAACMCKAQAIDMLMYYNARPTVFNGMFDFYTLRPLKGYSFIMFADLYELKQQIFCQCSGNNLYAVAAAAEEMGKCMIVHFSNDANVSATEFSLHIKGGDSRFRSYTLLNDKNTMTAEQLRLENGTGILTLQPKTVILLRF